MSFGKIGSVAFAGDFMRFTPTAGGYRSGQSQNVRWLFELVGALPLWREAGVRVSLPMPDALMTRLRRSAAPGTPWQAYVDNAESAWARSYDELAYPEFTAFFDELASHDLVIGFELPPALKRHLHGLSVPYLSLCIHPVRFLRDLVLGATTNAPSLAARLRTIGIGDDEVAVQARRFRAMFAKQRAAALALPSGLPLLAGQTERDSVLIQGGRFFDWVDCADAAAQALEPYPEVVLLEHPLRPSSASIVGFLRNRLGKTVIATNVNAYAAIFAPQPAPLMLTLASSLGVEARAAGMAAHFLLDDPRRQLSTPGVDIDDMAMLGHTVLTAAFWEGVLTDGDAVPPPPSDRFLYGDHYLRDTMGAWAYGPLRTGLHELRVRKVMAPAAALEPARRGDLLAALVGLPPGAEVTPAATAAAGVELVVKPPPTLPLQAHSGAVVDLSGDTALQHLVEGFHAPEHWGCWSHDLHCVIEIPVSPAAAGCELTVTLPIRAFEGMLDHAPVLRISSGGTLLAYVFFRRDGPSPLDVRVRLRARAPTSRIELDLSRRASSAVLGNGDNRWLGIALTRMTLTCEPAPATGAAAQPVDSWLSGIGPEPRPLYLRREQPAPALSP